jgi:hypothetical protein
MPEPEDYAAKEAEYRKHAADLLELAAQSQDQMERERLRGIADAWLRLAERMRELSEQKA